jgi:hypothetical protein
LHTLHVSALIFASPLGGAVFSGGGASLLFQDLAGSLAFSSNFGGVLWFQSFFVVPVRSRPSLWSRGRFLAGWRPAAVWFAVLRLVPILWWFLLLSMLAVPLLFRFWRLSPFLVLVRVPVLLSSLLGLLRLLALLLSGWPAVLCRFPSVLVLLLVLPRLVLSLVVGWCSPLVALWVLVLLWRCPASSPVAVLSGSFPPPLGLFLVWLAPGFLRFFAGFLASASFPLNFLSASNLLLSKEKIS